MCLVSSVPWALFWAISGVNIANFNLGRNEPGGDAIALLYVDQAIGKPIIDELLEGGLFNQAKPLEFDVD